MIEIINPGMLTTVQDYGRVGVMKNGFTQNGAMDRYSMTVANRLCGNCDNAPVLEITVMGITAKFNKDCIFCLSGADFSSKLNDNPIRTNKAYKASNGDVLTMGNAKNPGASASIACSMASCTAISSSLTAMRMA